MTIKDSNDFNQTNFKTIFIDPSYPDFLNNRIFDLENPILNRDNQLLPFVNLKNHLRNKSINIQTADRMGSVIQKNQLNDYWSLGILDYQKFRCRDDVNLKGFIIMEPPLVAPKLYKQLPILTRDFESVYLHNTIGDGYELNGVDISKLKKIYVPQPYCNVIESAWSNVCRLNRIAVIAGLHNPMFKKPELYSSRIKAVADLDSFGDIDLYGHGWDRWWSKKALTFSYWKNLRSIRRNYKGPVVSKIETLSKYRFSLCFENTQMLGYITEKIFDCFYAGTVPIYLGAKNISDLIPQDAYIDMRNYGSDDYISMWKIVRELSHNEWLKYRNAGRDFILGKGKSLYFNSLINTIF